MKKFFACLAALLMVASANAANVHPTPTEWIAWPGYCKAKLIEGGSADKYMLKSVAPNIIEKWKGILGERLYSSVHHGCRGILYIGRAEHRLQKDEMHYQHELLEAAAEAKFTLRYAPVGHPINSKMRAILARVKYGLGDTAGAISDLKALVHDAPESSVTYATLASYLYRQKNYAEARRVLETGLEKVPEPTAEMHYFLGLVLVKQKAWEEAREHAVEAYTMGYPLPGLRRKLKAVGHWER